MQEAFSSNDYLRELSPPMQFLLKRVYVLRIPLILFVSILKNPMQYTCSWSLISIDGSIRVVVQRKLSAEFFSLFLIICFRSWNFAVFLVVSFYWWFALLRETQLDCVLLVVLDSIFRCSFNLWNFVGLCHLIMRSTCVCLWILPPYALECWWNRH